MVMVAIIYLNRATVSTTVYALCATVCMRVDVLVMLPYAAVFVEKFTMRPFCVHVRDVFTATMVETAHHGLTDALFATVGTKETALAL
jgi:hypothetical protein